MGRIIGMYSVQGTAMSNTTASCHPKN
uniref:Uncharacterized protein n=1 Tax=Arundo donax TaxID=35708 RepID=A0A0A9F934_ARUDO